MARNPILIDAKVSWNGFFDISKNEGKMKKSRINANITTRELSTATGIKLSRIADIEKGRATPSQEEVDQLAIVLGSGITFVDQQTADKNKTETEMAMRMVESVCQEAKLRGFKKGQGGQGEMPCPKCGKNLYFTVASLNGHIWARCTTKGCLAWMQ